MASRPDLPEEWLHRNLKRLEVPATSRSLSQVGGLKQLGLNPVGRVEGDTWVGRPGTSAAW